MSIGLKRGTVALTTYDPRWPQKFEREKKRLQKILGLLIVDIEHIGSTSIPEMSAKPLIDVMVGVRYLQKDVKKILTRMRNAGYHYRPIWGRIDQHVLFAKGSEKSRTHYIHFVKYDGVIWNRDLLFRNYLRSHKAKAKEYERLKTKLAKRFPNDRGAYTKSKSDFVQQILRIADW